MPKTTEALSEEDEPEVLTATMEVSVKEAEETTHLRERLRRRRRWCVYEPQELAMMTGVSAEEDGP